MNKRSRKKNIGITAAGVVVLSGLILMLVWILGSPDLECSDWTSVRIYGNVTRSGPQGETRLIGIDRERSDIQSIEAVLNLITDSELERDFINSLSFLFGHKLMTVDYMKIELFDAHNDCRLECHVLFGNLLVMDHGYVYRSRANLNEELMRIGNSDQTDPQ